jgi:hypothetical protein
MSLLDMIPGVSTLKLIGAGAAVAIATASLVLSYSFLVIVPAAEREAEAIAKAEMIEKFNEVKNELASDAEKFRFSRAACRAAGGVFDFATGDCRQG